MTAYADSLVDILKRYLSHVVYIDDEFRVSWQSKEEESSSKPSRRSRRVSVKQEPVEEMEETEGPQNNLEAFCKIMRQEYPELLVTPVVYEEPMDMDNLVLHMKNARLLVLDWKLSEQITAVSLLNRAEFAGQLRFCVIYTSNLEEAKEEFILKIPNAKRDGFRKGECKGNAYDYIRVDSVIHMLCEKSKFDFHMIMEALIHIFIEEIGYFPIAFIDMISGLEEKVPYYLNEFSVPFDKLLLLQTSSDGLPVREMYHVISDMVVNNIKADINLNENVLQGIYEKQISLLRELLENEAEFETKLNISLQVIFDRLKCKENDRKILTDISAEDYKKVIGKAINDSADLPKGIRKAGVVLAELYGKKRAEGVIAQSELKDGGTEKIKGELADLYKATFGKKVEKLIPACLMILTNPDEHYNINRLVTSLKIVNYGKTERNFADIFQDCYEKNGNEMCLKCDSNGPKLRLLQNKLNSGDILYKKSEPGKEIETFYLCIVPSCHLLRPKKVEGNLVFVEGKVVAKKPDRPLKDSEHFTILPSGDDKESLVRIIWKYHKITALDLCRISCVDFENLYRPYRLTDEYTRQIMGEFVAFYSKVGVEELFVKADASLEQLLLWE